MKSEDFPTIFVGSDQDANFKSTKCGVHKHIAHPNYSYVELCYRLYYIHNKTVLKLRNSIILKYQSYAVKL